MSLDDIINAIVSGLKEFRFQDLLDILIITVIVYKIIEWSVNTKAFQLLKGLAVLLIVMLLSTICTRPAIFSIRCSFQVSLCSPLSSSRSSDGDLRISAESNSILCSRTRLLTAES